MNAIYNPLCLRPYQTSSQEPQLVDISIFAFLRGFERASVTVFGEAATNFLLRFLPNMARIFTVQTHPVPRADWASSG